MTTNHNRTRNLSGFAKKTKNMCGLHQYKEELGKRLFVRTVRSKKFYLKSLLPLSIHMHSNFGIQKKMLQTHLHLHQVRLQKNIGGCVCKIQTMSGTQQLLASSGDRVAPFVQANEFCQVNLLVQSMTIF